MIRKYIYADDTKERISFLFKLRLPWLLVGLLGGILSSILISKFESVISSNISLIFFLPIVVFMSDAVGEQTETIYVRSLSQEKVNFWATLFKELILGMILGLLFGVLIGLFAYFWLNSLQIALTVGLAMLVNVTLAPIIALTISAVLYKEKTDPALGGGPFTTMVQDILSLLIYLLVASLIIFR